MIVRSRADVAAAGHRVETASWSSERYLTRRHGLGFSVNMTIEPAGSDNVYEYMHHIEACLYVAGEGELTELATGAVYRIEPGVLYALDNKDRHRLRAHTELHLVCVFFPALEGGEVHDERGAYRAIAETE